MRARAGEEGKRERLRNRMAVGGFRDGRGPGDERWKRNPERGKEGSVGTGVI